MRGLTILAALAVTGSAGAAERLRGFDALAAASERLTMSGIGHGQSGRFLLGSATGRYERSAGTARRRGDKLALAGLRFSVNTDAGLLAGECRQAEESFGERAAPGVRVTTVATPLAVECRFALNGQPSGTLAMGEVPARGITVREDRRGTLRWDGREDMVVRSVHHFARSPLPAGAPLGYIVEQRGSAIAGVDVSRDTRVLLLPQDGARNAALAATTALGLMWEAEAE